MIASASTQLEQLLAELVAFASTKDVKYTGRAYAGIRPVLYTRNEVAHAAMGALESMSARLSVAAAVLKVSVSPELCDEFEGIAKGVRRAAGMRNGVVHAVWAVHEKKAEDLLLPTANERIFTRYTVKDFDNILERLRTEIETLVNFNHKCMDHLAEELLPPKAPRQKVAPRAPE